MIIEIQNSKFKVPMYLIYPIHPIHPIHLIHLMYLNKRRVSSLYRIATTDVPLLYSYPGGVRREQIVQDLPGGKNRKIFDFRASSPKFSASTCNSVL